MFKTDIDFLYIYMNIKFANPEFICHFQQTCFRIMTSLPVIRNNFIKAWFLKGVPVDFDPSLSYQIS